MAIDLAQLLRGSVFWAVFPFSSEAPFRSSQGVIYPDIEQFARAVRGTEAELVVRTKLRPVLLLHNGTRGLNRDVVCLRINSVKPKMKSDTQRWEQIVANKSPLFHHLPTGSVGLKQESIISMSSIGAVNVNAILAPAVGRMSDADLRLIARRLATILELDLREFILEEAKKLILLAQARNKN